MKLKLGLMVVALCLVVLISLACGQIHTSFAAVLKVIGNGLGLFRPIGFTPEEQAVIWHIRIPRTLVGLLVGAALGVSGAVMQGVFGNPLADPGIIGVSSGAAMGAVMAIVLGGAAQNLFVMPLFALVGALVAVLITVTLAMYQGKIPVMTLLLSGVAVSMFLGAITSGLLTFMQEQRLQQYLFWIVGGLDYRRWEHVYLAIGPIMVGMIFLFSLSRHLNVLVLGEQEAKAVGVPVMALRLLLLFIASLTTASAVCVSGSIGFVGLVVPHMMRILLGPDHKILLPTCALAGGIFLVVCDTIGRMILAPAELRVGVVTALTGAPYFLYLLRRSQKGGI